MFDALDSLGWLIWLAVAVGVLTAVLVVWLGFNLLRRYAGLGTYRGPDRRAAARRPGNPVAVVVAESTAADQHFPGTVIDRSMDGICLVLDKPMTVGASLLVRVADSPDGSDWVRAEVRNCRKQDKNWRVGCKFVERPPWLVMRLFG